MPWYLEGEGPEGRDGERMEKGWGDERKEGRGGEEEERGKRWRESKEKEVGEMEGKWQGGILYHLHYKNHNAPNLSIWICGLSTKMAMAGAENSWRNVILQRLQERNTTQTQCFAPIILARMYSINLCCCQCNKRWEEVERKQKCANFSFLFRHFCVVLLLCFVYFTHLVDQNIYTIDVFIPYPLY